MLINIKTHTLWPDLELHRSGDILYIFMACNLTIQIRELSSNAHKHESEVTCLNKHQTLIPGEHLREHSSFTSSDPLHMRTHTQPLLHTVLDTHTHTLNRCCILSWTHTHTHTQPLLHTVLHTHTHTHTHICTHAQLGVCDIYIKNDHKIQDMGQKLYTFTLNVG